MLAEQQSNFEQRKGVSSLFTSFKKHINGYPQHQRLNNMTHRRTITLKHSFNEDTLLNLPLSNTIERNRQDRLLSNSIEPSNAICARSVANFKQMQ